MVSPNFRGCSVLEANRQTENLHLTQQCQILEIVTYHYDIGYYQTRRTVRNVSLLDLNIIRENPRNVKHSLGFGFPTFVETARKVSVLFIDLLPGVWSSCQYCTSVLEPNLPCPYMQEL